MFTTILAAVIILSAPGDPDLKIGNEFIEIGVSNDFGGAITYLSVRGQNRNLVNNHDKGRQVQQSIYAGPMLDRKAEGQRSNWSPWPWNPVQAGDSYDNKSKMLAATSDGREIYTKVQPMLWDMNNEIAEVYYETWITLEGPVAHVRNQVTCFRTDNRWGVELKDQELPAAYSIGALHNIVTYEGSQPWTNDPALTTLPHVYPSKRMNATEKWAALVDDTKWGWGVYNPDIDFIIYMFAGNPGGETGDSSTGYVAPVKQMALDKNSTFTYEYYLIVGTLDEIRSFVYVKEGKAPEEAFNPEPPASTGGKSTSLLLLGGSLAALVGLGVAAVRFWGR